MQLGLLPTAPKTSIGKYKLCYMERAASVDLSLSSQGPGTMNPQHQIPEAAQLQQLELSYTPPLLHHKHARTLLPAPVVQMEEDQPHRP